MRDRYKLLGTYKTPHCKVGETVWCEVRGWVQIVGISDGRIQWPMGRLKTRYPGKDALVVFKGLAKAVKRESSQAIQHWWGVGSSSVWKWRRALDVPQLNEGTRKSHADYFANESNNAPRRLNIAAAKRGKKRSKATVEAMRKANLGKKVSKTTRKRMSASHKQRGTRPPWLNKAWEPWEDELLRKGVPTAEIVERTGRTTSAVLSRRRKLRLPDGRTRAERKQVGRSV